MKILNICGMKAPTPDRKANAFASHGAEITDISPTLFSAFTAMKISGVIDRQDIDVVVASSLKDAMAAVSARDIARKKDVRIVMNVEANSAIPRGVPADICNNVDGWVFASDRLRDAYSSCFRKGMVIAPTTYAYRTDIKCVSHSPRVLSWIGAIRRPEVLRAFLEVAEECEGDFVLRVCGEGDAAKVMPVVKMSRHLGINSRLTWVGNNYNVEQEIASCDAIMASDHDVTEIEAAALLSDLPLLRPADLASFLTGTYVAGPDAVALPPDEYASRFTAFLRSLAPTH